MKMNWKVRAKNPFFWLGLGGVVFTAMGVTPEMFTSWSLVGESIMRCVGNPYMLGSVAVAVIGVLHDPTTKGLGDGK